MEDNIVYYFQWIHIDAERLAPGELDKYAKVYEKMDGVVCVSETAKQALIKLYPSLKDKAHVIYNFFNTDLIKKKSDDCVKLDNSTFSILSIGRMVEQKGYLRAMDVINRLAREGYKFKWTIIGDGGDKQEIENKIRIYGIEDKVELLGLKDNPYPYIKTCDLFFLPSLYEGFPTVTIEAKVLNKPVLATEVSGIHEQIEDGKNGIIVENSEIGIYQGLKKFLDEPMLLKKLSDNSGMQKVLDNDMKYEKFMGFYKNRI